MKKTSLLGVAAMLATIGVGSVGIATTRAASSPDALYAKKGLQQALIERFGLPPADVKTFFADHHTAMRVVRKENAQQHLQTLVATGKINQEQADALTAKHEEQKAFREAMQGLTNEERREAMKAHAEEMKQWAHEQGLAEILPKKPGSGRDHIRFLKRGH